MLRKILRMHEGPEYAVIAYNYAKNEIDRAYFDSEQSDTTYLSKQEREQFLVRLDPVTQKLCILDKATKQLKILDTTDFNSKIGRGYAAFALDKKGRLYVHEHRSELYPRAGAKFFYHSSFFSAGSGICFGMICVEQGEITYISNQSGHYKPSAECLKAAVHRLHYATSKDATIEDVNQVGSKNDALRAAAALLQDDDEWWENNCNADQAAHKIAAP